MKFYCLVVVLAVLVTELVAGNDGDDEDDTRTDHVTKKRKLTETDKPSSSTETGAARDSGRNQELITLNVGGQIFTTTRTTLCNREPNSMLARMFCSDSTVIINPGLKDANGAYFIDRSPKHFEPVLNYLRHGKLVLDLNVNPDGILQEIMFFGVYGLLPMLNLPNLTRKDVIQAIRSKSDGSNPRNCGLAGANLAGADLSHLKLSELNLMYANLRGADLRGSDLSYSNLEHADLSQSNLAMAILDGTNLAHANLESSILKGVITIEFSPDSRPRANFEGANLRDTIFQDSKLTHVNFRGAILKGSNFHSSNLKGAIFINADLENCNLSRSNLAGVDLTNANIKFARFPYEFQK